MDLGSGKRKTRQVEEEQRLIDAMYSRLDSEVTGSLSARERAEASRVEEPQELSARDQEVTRLTDRIKQLRSAERSLCFGRIDGTEQAARLHIGRIGLRTDAGEPLLVDWRAEAARPFYSATMASPMGLHRRRHLRLDHRTVVDVSDEILDGAAPTGEDVVGDGPLVAALSSARTGRMREAAATLQTEQDEIVRSPHRGIMVVDGGPGTGKTIVALHRAAYVLYEFPSIADRGVLVYGPNRRFLTYITDVLPSLGENDVRLATLPDLVGIEAPRSEPDDLGQIKGRAQFAGVLARWVQAREPQGIPLEVRTAHGTVILDSDLVDAARRSAVQDDIGHNPARELFTERIVDELVNELEQQTARELSDFEADLKALQGIDLDRMFANGSHSAGSDDANASADGLEIDWDRIRDELLDDANIDRIISGVWPRLRAEDAVRGVLTDRATLARALPDVAAEQLTRMGDLNGIDWSNADLALLDEARALIDGPPHDVFGHIVVDEAQQLTQMQWRTLMRRCPSRSMTIVGDLAQTGPITTIRTWNEALQPFVSDRFAHRTLTINYRTTEEILHTTEPLLARIAPEQRLSRSIRHGEHPTSVTVTEIDIASKLVELIASTQEKHPGELIGIITATQRSISLNTKLTRTGYTMIAAPDARGLEFDTVIIVDPDGIQHASAAGLRDLYVAQTRATKRLITLTIAPT
jgi:DNA helicase IV